MINYWLILIGFHCNRYNACTKLYLYFTPAPPQTQGLRLMTKFTLILAPAVRRKAAVAPLRADF